MNVLELAERNQQSESGGLIAYWITDETPGY